MKTREVNWHLRLYFNVNCKYNCLPDRECVTECDIVIEGGNNNKIQHFSIDFSDASQISILGTLLAFVSHTPSTRSFCPALRIVCGVPISPSRWIQWSIGGLLRIYSLSLKCKHCHSSQHDIVYTDKHNVIASCQNFTFQIVLIVERDSVRNTVTWFTHFCPVAKTWNVHDLWNVTCSNLKIWAVSTKFLTSYLIQLTTYLII